MRRWCQFRRTNRIRFKPDNESLFNGVAATARAARSGGHHNHTSQAGQVGNNNLWERCWQILCVCANARDKNNKICRKYRSMRNTIQCCTAATATVASFSGEPSAAAAAACGGAARTQPTFGDAFGHESGDSLRRRPHELRAWTRPFADSRQVVFCFEANLISHSNHAFYVLRNVLKVCCKLL